MNLSLKTARVISDLSQEAMADAIGVSQSRVWRIEQQQSSTRIEELKKWFNVCNDEGKEVIRNYLKSSFFD